MLLIFFWIDEGSYIIYALYLDENKNLNTSEMWHIPGLLWFSHKQLPKSFQ